MILSTIADINTFDGVTINDNATFEKLDTNDRSV